MPLLSIIIPILNEAPRIRALLTGLRAALPEAQLIVVDGGSTDASAELSRGLCDAYVVSEPGRACQMNRGVTLARGDYLMFLHADTQLPAADYWPGVLQLERPAWGFFAIRIDGDELAMRMVESAMNWRSGLTHVATGDQCLFVSRQLWESAGGYADIPLMEDVELSKRLRSICAPHIVGPAVITSGRRWRERGVLPTILMMWWLRFAYFCGVSPNRLWRWYYGG